MIKLEHLRTFVIVAEAGSLQEAAQHIYRTPAALSMTLKQLEEDIGGPLFETDRKGRLSALGQFTLDQLKPMLGRFDIALHDLRHFAQGKIGAVKVASVPSAAILFVPKALRRLRQERPEVRVELRDSDSISVVKAVLDGSVALGIASTPEPIEGLVVKHLMTDPFVWVCPTGHPLGALNRPVLWSDIHPEEFIAHGLCSGLRIAPLDELVHHCKLMVLNTASLLGFVRAGMGMTLLPALAVPQDGSVLSLPCGPQKVERKLSLIYRSHLVPAPPAQALIEAISLEALAQG